MAETLDNTIVVIEGQAGAGKTTAAQMLAESYGFSNFNTGTLFRATAAALLYEGANKLFEDKIFFVCKGGSDNGVLRDRFEGGENQWLALDELLGKDKKFSSVHDELKIIQTDSWMIEKAVRYNQSLF